jgi:D-alanyl-D-alanine carboxypeptidase
MNPHDGASVAPGATGRRLVRRSVGCQRADERLASRTPRARRLVAIGFVLGATLLAVLAPAPPVAAIGPLPACRLADIPTVPRDYNSWSTTLVDWLLTVGKDYKPPDLVSVREAGIAGGGYIRKVTIDDLRAMAQAAAKAGAPIGVWSPYRSYQTQVAIFNGYASAYGFQNAITYSQRPGHSEHQLGLAIDFMTAGGGSPLPGDWGTTAAGRWMAKNAWKYGWVLSYPKGKGGALWSDASCFHYEPWHYRYLGRELAAKVHAAGLTIREYLWTHFTMVDPKTGKPIPTATPIPTASPTPTPSPSATPTAVAISTPSADASADPQPVSSWFGIDPTVILAGLLVLALASIGFIAWRVVLRH